MMTFMSEFVGEMVLAGFATRGEIVGCSQADVSKLEEALNVTLPETYRAFLTTMGRGAGSFSRGTDFLYESLFHIKDDFAYVLREDQYLEILTPDVFVIAAHQGVIYHFFYTGDNNPDPPVHGYLEGDRKTKLINNSFSEFLWRGLKEGRAIRASNRLLRSFNDNRLTNPDLAVEAGKQYIEHCGNSYPKTAEGIRDWIETYEKRAVHKRNLWSWLTRRRVRI